MEQIVRPVAVIERLDQKADPLFAGQVGGSPEIRDEDTLGLASPVSRHRAGQAVNGPPSDRHGIVERAAKQRGEILLAPRHRGEAGCGARRRGRVDAENGEAMPLDLAPDIGGGMVVRGLQLDRLEARRRGRREPLQQRKLGEEIGEIGGEARHAPFLEDSAGHGNEAKRPNPTDAYLFECLAPVRAACGERRLSAASPSVQVGESPGNKCCGRSSRVTVPSAA